MIERPEPMDVLAAERAQALSALCERHGVILLMAFGSQAKAALGWLRAEVSSLQPGASDVDIGVKPEAARRMSLRDQVRMAAELEDLFLVPRVDFILLDDADAFLAANIIRGERLYARDRRAADEYELYVLRRAGDLAPFERERMRMIEGRP